MCLAPGSTAAAPHRDPVGREHEGNGLRLEAQVAKHPPLTLPFPLELTVSTPRRPLSVPQLASYERLQGRLGYQAPSRHDERGLEVHYMLLAKAETQRLLVADCTLM